MSAGAARVGLCWGHLYKASQGISSVTRIVGSYDFAVPHAVVAIAEATAGWVRTRVYGHRASDPGIVHPLW